MDSEFERKVIEYYLKNTQLSQQAVADHFGISKPSVSRFLKKYGYTPRKRRTPDMEKDAIIAYYLKEPKTIEDVAAKFNFCEPKIVELLHKYNICMWTREDLCQKDLIVDYFENIDTEEKAYFLGFLYADGCIYESDGVDRLVFQLKESDIYILKRLKEVTKAPRSLVEDKRDNSNTLTITNNTFCNNLKKWGMVTYKENRITLPTIDEDLMPHFIRGYFDGDGCITIKDVTTGRKVLSFSGKDALLTQIELFVRKKIGVTPKRTSFEGGTHALRWGAKEDLALWYDYLYSNATIYLKRKKAIFDM